MTPTDMQALGERLHLLLSGDAILAKTDFARATIEQAIAALASRPDAQAGERYDLLQAAVNCPHEIESNRVVLHYSDKQPGHNALAQLHERLARAATLASQSAGVPGWKCTTCQDGELLPQYGCAPHDCFYKIGKQIGQSEVHAADTWPDNFEVDEESDGRCGTFHCPVCGPKFKSGKPLAAAPSPDREQPAYSAPFTTDVPQCCGEPSTCNDPCASSPSRECGEPPAENAGVRNKIAAALHYLDHWDTVAYPTLDHAVWESIAAAKLTCSECGERQGPVRQIIEDDSVAKSVFMRSLYGTMSNRDDLWAVWWDAWSAASAPTLGECRVNKYCSRVCELGTKGCETEHAPAVAQPMTDAARDVLIERAQRLLEGATWNLGGVLSSQSKASDIPSRASSAVKSRHLASLRDALAEIKHLDRAKGE